MTVSKSHPSLNIQENLKTTISSGTPSVEVLVSIVAEMLTEPGWKGRVLRVLVTRLRYRDQPYTSNEMEVLLALTIALDRLGLWRRRR